MGTTLDNGIYLPDEGERNCYEGLAGNWVALDNHLGSTNIHVTINDKQAWNGHVADSVKHVTAEDKAKWDAVTSKADASALTAHTGDTTIHVTAEDKSKWDAVTTKANDTDVVHKSGAETIAGPKTFSDNASYTSDVLFSSLGVLDVSGGRIASIYKDKDKKEVARLTGGVQSSGRSLLELTVRDIFNNAYQTCGFGLRFQSNSVFGLFPITDNTHLIGASNVKLKSLYTNQINGIEPSSLSLPQDRTSRVDISAYFTATASGDVNKVTAPGDGFIYLALIDILLAHCFSQTSNGLTHYGQTFGRSNVGQLYVMFPIRKNDVFACQWYTTAAAVTVSNAFFIPCKGNI